MLKPEGIPLKRLTFKGISMVLWAGTAYLAGYQIFLVRSIVSKTYLSLLKIMSLPINVLERLSATGLGNIASLIMAIVAIVIIVAGFDYHWNHRGEPRSFKVLLLTLIFQSTIQALYILS